MNSINIRKRDGSLDPLDINLIREKAKFAFTNIKENSLVNIDDFLLSIREYIKDGISSQDITEMLIKSGLDKVEPGSFEYDLITARLLVKDIEHRVYKESGLLTYFSWKENIVNDKLPMEYKHELSDFLGFTYKEFINHGTKKEVIHPIIQGVFKDYGLIKLGSFIKPERDLQFKYIGIKTLEDRYLKRDPDGNIFELPQWRFMTVATFLSLADDIETLKKGTYYHKIWMEYLTKNPNTEANDLEFKIFMASQYYDIISKFYMMTATPTLNNAGTNNHQLSSCFQLDRYDSIEGIIDNEKESALYSKYGGGLGEYWGRMRASGDPVDTAQSASQGISSWLKISNDVVVAVNQLGVRPGSKAPYLDLWHPNIKEFLDIKRKGGEERKRAHDLFPAVIIPDLFMKIVFENATVTSDTGTEETDTWFLMSTYFTKDKLINCHGEEWEKRYRELVANPAVPKTRLKASELWKYILNTYYKDGNPFLFWRDNHNKSHALKDVGPVVSSQLCTELSQVTWPDEYGVKLSFVVPLGEDIGDVASYLDRKGVINYNLTDEYLILPEHTSINTNFGSIDVNKVSSLHKLNIDTKLVNIKRVDREPLSVGQTAVCNLASLNVNMPVNEREHTAKLTMRMLDNVIDLNFYPTAKSQISAKRFRAVAIGKMNIFNYVVNTKGCKWDSLRARNEIAKVMIEFTKYEVEASCDLATERGSFDYFEQSSWSKGKLPYEETIKNLEGLVDVSIIEYAKSVLRELKIITPYGIRNGYLQAPAPTGSISLISDCTSGVEGIYKRHWMEENSSGLIPVVAPGLDASNWERYNSVYDYDPVKIMLNTVVVQSLTDQSISYNTYVEDKEYSIGDKKVDLLTKLSMTFYMGWKGGMKSNYYLRSKSPELKEEVIDRSTECTNCQ